jgi:hypothetical protein
MPMTYDEYQNKRSWLIDTAETPADQKRLKAQLEKLKAQYDAGKKAAATKPKTPVRDKTADAARLRATERAQMLRSETPGDKAFREAMEKANWDPSKVPGFKIDRNR